MEDVTVDKLNQLCIEDYEPLEIMMGKAVETLDALQLHAETVLDVLSCERIVPIYTGTAYNVQHQRPDLDLFRYFGDCLYGDAHVDLSIGFVERAGCQ